MSYGQYNQNPYQQGPAQETGYSQVRSLLSLSALKIHTYF